MAYNNGFPIGYQPTPINYPANYQPQPVYQPQSQSVQQQQNPGMIWVQGEAGAKSYLLTPNTTLPLWDSEQQTIYLKSADASGMPSMKILDYTIREQGVPHKNNLTEEQPKIDLSGFVTYDEFNDRLDELAKKLDRLTNKPKQQDKREYRRNRERDEEDGE